MPLKFIKKNSFFSQNYAKVHQVKLYTTEGTFQWSKILGFGFGRNLTFSQNLKLGFCAF